VSLNKISDCLVVIHNWRDDEKQRKRIAFTLTPFICAFIFSVIPLIWQNYNYNGGFYCDISASPIGEFILCRSCFKSTAFAPSRCLSLAFSFHQNSISISQVATHGSQALNVQEAQTR
jgi:ABC-type uncharacterized transport system permease subunit